jgi:hypothetical protein
VGVDDEVSNGQAAAMNRSGVLVRMLRPPERQVNDTADQSAVIQRLDGIETSLGALRVLVEDQATRPSRMLRAVVIPGLILAVLLAVGVVWNGRVNDNINALNSSEQLALENVNEALFASLAGENQLAKGFMELALVGEVHPSSYSRLGWEEIGSASLIAFCSAGFGAVLGFGLSSNRRHRRRGRSS